MEVAQKEKAYKTLYAIRLKLRSAKAKCRTALVVEDPVFANCRSEQPAP